jgi:hypothetical protein
METEIRRCVKMAFDDEESALAKAKQIKKDAKTSKKFRKRIGRKQVRARRMSAYLCRYCCKYHLTSSPQRRKKSG